METPLLRRGQGGSLSGPDVPEHGVAVLSLSELSVPLRDYVVNSKSEERQNYDPEADGHSGD